VTFTVDNTFDVTSIATDRERRRPWSKDSDPLLKDTYVIFGAHLDHVGYARGSEAKGKVNNPIAQDSDLEWRRRQRIRIRWSVGSRPDLCDRAAPASIGGVRLARG
jgi:hypothetical protein